MDEMNRLQV